MFEIIPAPTLHPGIEAFFRTYVPAPNTLHWSKFRQANGGGTMGCWYDGPLSLCDGVGIEIPPALVSDYAERIRGDYLARGLMDAKILDPAFNELGGLWDHLHFSLGLLDDLHAHGFEWAGHYASRLLVSYHANANTPWLRDGGEPKYSLDLVYGDNGRPRCAGWLLFGLLSGYRIYRRAGNLSMAAAALSLMADRIEQIERAWPLLDVGQGDSAPVSLTPHVRTFMAGILGAALRRVAQIDTTGRAVRDLLARVRHQIEMAHRPRIGPAAYAYDVAASTLTDGQPVDGEKITHGASSVAVWCADALRGDPPRAGMLDALRESARAARWPDLYPLSALHFFGDLL